MLGAARLSTVWGLPPVVIGAVVIGFGTSLPELLASGIAAARGDIALAVGNVVGSNLANLTLVLGIGSLVAPMVVSSRIVRREAPVCLAAVAAFGVVAALEVPQAGGIVLLLAGVSAVVITIVAARRAGDDNLGAETDELVGDVLPDTRQEVARTLVGLIGTVASAYLLVESAVSLADRAGLSGGFVGASLVGLGTSAPELVTVIQAARRNETDLILGNLLGSNVFNSLLVGGTAIALGPGILEENGTRYLGPAAATVVAAIVWWMVTTDRRVTRVEAGALLVLYCCSLPLLI